MIVQNFIFWSFAHAVPPNTRLIVCGDALLMYIAINFRRQGNIPERPILMRGNDRRMNQNATTSRT
jgi:hypothetical protein